jgi:DNA repair exonuclease SbcCD ATPase subunit
MCYEKAFIDFSQFSSALIIGKLANSDLYSNGVGKTTIFKAIEYCLFNQADVNLENILRDDTDKCRVCFDFSIAGEEYRLVRIRTKKGTSDLSLYQRIALAGEINEVLHDENEIILIDNKYWKNISSRRTSDTEKDLAKLIKVNYKSFRVFVHFMQNDFSGLTTSSPEKRKAILKDALNLAVYTKLEKIAKDKYAILTKEADKYQTQIDAIGDPNKDIPEIEALINGFSNTLAISNQDLKTLNDLFAEQTEQLNTLNNKHNNLESKFSEFLIKEKSATSDLSKLERSIKEYSDKKTLVINSAKNIIVEIKNLETQIAALFIKDPAEIDKLNEAIISKKEAVAELNLTIRNNKSKYEELKLPLPKDSVCRHCRQELTEEHRKICQQQIDEEIKLCQETVKLSSDSVVKLSKNIDELNQEISAIRSSKNKLDDLNVKIAGKKSEVEEKRNFNKEYDTLIKKFTADLNSKNQEILIIKEEIKKSSIEEASIIKNDILNLRRAIDKTKQDIASKSKEITQITNQKAINQHNLQQKIESKNKKEELTKTLKQYEDKIKIYPSVLQAFSSSGIPNLIIQNVLDDLQIEANNLLQQLKPGLQLEFAIEKTNDDGVEEDTLAINYFLQNKSRYYEQLSGAQKLAVTFALKLGLSFLLQKMIGVDIKLLLLDEIDQSLDKAAVDAFSEIIKFFQKDFTILVITHNDRLKDKFTNGILVEQNENLVSRARVVSSW